MDKKTGRSKAQKRTRLNEKRQARQFMRMRVVKQATAQFLREMTPLIERHEALLRMRADDVPL